MPVPTASANKSQISAERWVNMVSWINSVSAAKKRDKKITFSTLSHEGRLVLLRLIEP